MIRYVQTKPLDFERIKKSFQDSINTNTFTNNGPLKQKLEQKLHTLLEIDSNKSVVCASNGTFALYVATVLLQKRKGDLCKWVTPAFNFPAAVVNNLNTDVIDIELDTYSLSLDKIDDNYDGCIVPSLFGTLPNLKKLVEFCKLNHKFLILDNASSPLSYLDDKSINNYGDISIGSLHHTKYLGYGEGGYLVVDADDYDLANALLNFGFQDSRDYQTSAINGKMSDIAAAFILQHLSSYDLQKHATIQKQMIEFVESIQGVEVFNNNGIITYGNMPIIFNRPISHLIFRDVGIEANKYYKPLLPLPNSKWLYERIINLPLHAGLSDYEIELILKKVEYEAKRIN